MKTLLVRAGLGAASLIGLATMASAHKGNHSEETKWQHCRVHHSWLYCVLNGKAAGLRSASESSEQRSAPPPPAPPPPPPPPPCNPGPFIVYFDWDKTTVTPEAANVLEAAVGAYQNCGGASVLLAGHADSSQSAERSQTLSEERAKAVADQFVMLGMSEEKISQESFGESQLRVPTGDDVRELLNRRVEIIFSPPN